jgi:hypothetical protein
MDNIIPMIVGALILMVILTILSVRLQKKALQNQKEKFSLIEGEKYEILQNGGRTIKDLTFRSVSFGRKSVNGNIDFLFTKESTYRGEKIERNIKTKAGSIWKCTKL